MKYMLGTPILLVVWCHPLLRRPSIARSRLDAYAVTRGRNWSGINVALQVDLQRHGYNKWN